MTAPVADVAVPHCYHRHKVDISGAFYTRPRPDAGLSSHSSLSGSSQNEYSVLIKKLIESARWQVNFSATVLFTQRQTQTQMFVVLVWYFRVEINFSNKLVWVNSSSWSKSHSLNASLSHDGSAVLHFSYLYSLQEGFRTPYCSFTRALSVLSFIYTR